MPELPGASTTIQDVAGGFGSGTGYLAVFGCVESNADLTPRIFTSASAMRDVHGYSPAADIIAMHISETNKPVLFVGLPTASVGTIGQQNDDGVTGSCSITAVAGAHGVLEEVNGIFRSLTDGTIGTDQILGELSLDGGVTFKKVRLGTANTYTIPYVGIVLNFGAGDLNVDDEFLFTSTAPMWDGDGFADAISALGTQNKRVRSILVVGDLPNSTFAGYVTTGVNAYETDKNRYVYARAQVRDHLPLASKSSTRRRMTGTPTITFLEVGATGDTITRNVGSFIADGFAIGDWIVVTGSASNNIAGKITNVTALVLTLDTADLVNEGPVSNVSIYATETITFLEVGATGDTISRSSGSWLSDGFRIGDRITVAGTASNNFSNALVTNVTALTITLDTQDLVNEVIGSTSVTLTKGETLSGWVSSVDAAFASVDAQRRIDLGAGRGRKLSPITGYEFRRPVQWAASIREYQHDIHVATWAKELGPLDGWSLEDTNQQIVEYDEENTGGLLAARFTCFRTWGNGPEGAYIAMSLTRADENSNLSLTNNMCVANEVCTIVQANTELVVGKTFVLDSDGHATAASLSQIEQRVNTPLRDSLLKNGPEGPRASSVRWIAAKDDVLNVPDATLNGTALVEMNGTIFRVNTVVAVQTGG